MERDLSGLMSGCINRDIEGDEEEVIQSSFVAGMQEEEEEDESEQFEDSEKQLVDSENQIDDNEKQEEESPQCVGVAVEAYMNMEVKIDELPEYGEDEMEIGDEILVKELQDEKSSQIQTATTTTTQTPIGIRFKKGRILDSDDDDSSSQSSSSDEEDLSNFQQQTIHTLEDIKASLALLKDGPAKPSTKFVDVEAEEEDDEFKGLGGVDGENFGMNLDMDDPLLVVKDSSVNESQLGKDGVMELHRYFKKNFRFIFFIFIDNN